MEKFILLPGQLSKTLVDDCINLGSAIYRLQHYKRLFLLESKWSSLGENIRSVILELDSTISLLTDYIDKILSNFNIQLAIGNDGLGFLPKDPVNYQMPILTKNKLILLDPTASPSADHYDRITLQSVIYEGFLLGTILMRQEMGLTLQVLEGNLHGDASNIQWMMRFALKNEKKTLQELNDHLKMHDIKVMVRGKHHVIELA